MLSNQIRYYATMVFNQIRYYATMLFNQELVHVYKPYCYGDVSIAVDSSA